MHMKVKAIRVQALALLAAAMVACGGGGATSGGGSSTPKIGVVLTYNLPGFWGNYLKYEDQYRTQLGVTLVGPLVANVEANGNEAAQQINDVKSLIAQGVQALIVNPADSAAIGPALDYAKSKHVPVVTVDVAPSQGSVYMIVRADNTAYGSKSCDYIASHATGRLAAPRCSSKSTRTSRSRPTRRRTGAPARRSRTRPRR